ncbi:hypothetical protein MHUMG1_08905 [Metarhizium humberi]|uniref:Uncharacterized protein n=1 Tax=Metarhizium humberi TaxID=2596975 RepID=A0A9P8S4R0_9HYPO|nr:hypothetical protein MHUMG1_08905 [Metarhizium humberi]
MSKSSSLKRTSPGGHPDLGSDGEPKPEPSVQHQLEKRTQLQAILSDFRRDLGINHITDRKIRAVDLMVLLASRREARSPAQSSSTSTLFYGSNTRGSPPDIKPVMPNVNVKGIPLVLALKRAFIVRSRGGTATSSASLPMGTNSNFEHLDDAFVPILRGPRKRRPTIVILRLDIGAARLQQQLDDAFVPVLCGPQKRRLTEVILSLSIGSARLQQQLDDAFVPVLYGPRKRRLTEVILGLGIGSARI